MRGARKLLCGDNGCLILGGGEIKNYHAVAGMLGDGVFVICADSGYGHCEKLGVRPGLLVGDLDSIQGSPPEGVPRITLKEDKDVTDTDFAVREALSRGYKSILLAGMTGGRPDHTIANIQLLAWLSKKNAEAVITDGETRYYAVTASEHGGEIRVPPEKNHYFSVFALGTCSNVSIKGAKYPLSEYALRFDEPRAVSNEFLNSEALITLDKGTLIIIVTPKGGGEEG